MLERALKLQAAIPSEVLATWRKAAPDNNCSSGVTIPINTQIAARHNRLGGGHGYVSAAFACNQQRDEVRDLHDITGALGAQPGIKQQIVAQGCDNGGTDYLTMWDTQQARIFTPDGVSPTLAGADGNE